MAAMDFILNWLREEREVIRHAKITAMLLLVAGIMFGAAGALYIQEHRVEEAQLALSTAQENRDLWRDRYEALDPATKALASRVPPKARPTPVTPQGSISWPRTLLLIGGCISTVVAAIVFIPWPRGASGPSKPAAAKVAAPPPPKPTVAPSSIGEKTVGPTSPPIPAIAEEKAPPALGHLPAFLASLPGEEMATHPARRCLSKPSTRSQYPPPPLALDCAATSDKPQSSCGSPRAFVRPPGALAPLATGR